MKKLHSHSKSHSSFIVASLSQFAQATPTDMFDIRCEYDVPRFIDLLSEEEQQQQ